MTPIGYPFEKCLIFAALIATAAAQGCSIFTDNQCDGDVVITDPSYEANRWFTPAKDQQGWQASFQDFDRLVVSATVVYDSPARLAATVTVKALHRDGVDLTYSSSTGRKQSQISNEFKFSSVDTKEPITIIVSGSDGSSVELEPIDFVWTAPTVVPISGDTAYKGGQKGAIVEFFGWPHSEIAKECEFLADAGYMGAKFFPSQEQVMSGEPFQSDGLNPWYFMYQPVSYKLAGRMGSRNDLRSAVHTCRSLGVRAYADAVLNHMVGGGNDANPKHEDTNCNKWGNKSSSGAADWHNGASSSVEGASPAYTQSYVYEVSNVTGLPPSQEFPAVPWGPQDFHCERVLNSWTDPLDLNAGWLEGLVDLNTERESVQQRLADYLSDLVGIGFSGVRIDAAKHIQPDDLVGIFSKFRANMGGELPSDFVAWLEVLLGGESDLLMCNPESGYNYGSYLADKLSAEGFSDDEIEQIKIWNSGYPKEPANGYCTITPSRNAIQNDDADQQTEGSTSRDMGDQGCVLIENCGGSEEHKSFEIKLFEDPNGILNDNDVDYPIRLILSSFWWQNETKGIPDGLSDCRLCTTNCESCVSTLKWDAYNNASTGYDDEYTRPHRDADIIAAMRSWMKI